MTIARAKPASASDRDQRWLSGMAKVVAATVLYGVFHSLVASLAAKQAAARWFGSQNRNGLYRAFYIAQSFLTMGILARYAWRQPNRRLYEVRGRWARLMHLGQITAVLYAVWAARQVGVRRITGLQSLNAWLRAQPAPVEPEAQGPALDAEGKANTAGPFALSRHPLNFVPVPIFWLWPRMTTNLLGYNLVLTAYLILGSIHEEVRLRTAFPRDYAAYQRSGVSFYLPLPRRSARVRTDQLISERPPSS